MDVAREMRENREMAEQVLARDEVRATLRQKLKRSAEISGDRVTDAEIDAAIDAYFADRHRFVEPKFSFNLLIAHLWVRRTLVLSATAAVLICAGTIWGLFLSPFAPLSPTLQAQRAAATRQADATQLVEQIRAASLEPEVVETAERLAKEVQVAGNEDPTTALAAMSTLTELHQELLETYELRIARDSDGSNLIETRYRSENGDRLSGQFVLVEAVDSSGKVIPKRIRNAETGNYDTVKIWAERIPPEVFERLAADKLSDGVMNETVFGTKERGRLELQVTMPGLNGQPLERSIQITNW